MSEWRSRMTHIVDGHVHMGSVSQEDSLLAIREAAGIERMALVSIQNPEAGSGLAQSLYMKARHPDLFYVMAGLNHAGQLSGGQVQGTPLVEQLDEYVRIGCDGIKMIEGKPTARQRMNVPLTDPYYADYWAHVEELGLPIVFHVNDPEEFWDPARIPGWAKARNWGYGPEDVQKEQLYTEVDAVLAHHPKLRIIFAHFYFLSADLPRAVRFLEEHPTVCFDLTPGVEMLYNLSRNVEASRAFFADFSDRIVYGTDLFSSQPVDEGRLRAGLVFRWLESEDTFRVPEGADFLLGPPEDGIIHGMSLPDDVLRAIYGGNWQRMVGSAPRALDVKQAIEMCQRLADLAEAMSGQPAAETEAGRVAESLDSG